MTTKASGEAALYIVPTPIGNLGDMLPRGVEVLQSVALIACEDRRHSATLLAHFGISTPCVSYHEHSGADATAGLMAKLESGQSIALISDAGTPLVSDPGYRLVEAAVAADITIVPLPGPCAAIVALSAAGLPTDRFVFEGFLPAKSAARQSRLRSLLAEDRTLVFYEAPHRVLETLGDMVTVFGADRRAVLARELTKRFETLLRAPLSALEARVAGDADQRRGECVLLLEGAPAASTEIGPEVRRVLEVLLEEMSPAAAARTAAKITGCSRKQLYALTRSE